MLYNNFNKVHFDPVRKSRYYWSKREKQYFYSIIDIRWQKFFNNNNYAIGRGVIGIWKFAGIKFNPLTHFLLWKILNDEFSYFGILVNRLIERNFSTLTSVFVNFVESVLGNREHPHVRPEFLDERLDNGLSCGVRCHPYAFCGYFLTAVLKVESHYPMKLQVLENKK